MSSSQYVCRVTSSFTVLKSLCWGCSARPRERGAKLVVTSGDAAIRATNAALRVGAMVLLVGSGLLGQRCARYILLARWLVYDEVGIAMVG